MKWQAKWIWNPADPNPHNTHVLFRKHFRAPAKVADGMLRISADSRYRLYLNGEWLGDGPCRSWPAHQQFDVYDVAGRLLPGENLVAVDVHHYGTSTFHYIHGPAGLIVQIDAAKAGKPLLASAKGWKTAVNAAYNRRSPRISCQMPFEEQFDARLEPEGWEWPDFDDSDWDSSVEVAPALRAHWKDLNPRDVPFLTREPVHPVRVAGISYVRPPALVETVCARRMLYPEVTHSNHRGYHAVVATTIVSKAEQDASLLHATSQIGGAVKARYLNGEKVEGQTLCLNRGPNELITVLDGPREHCDDMVLALDGPSAMSLQAPFKRPGKWLFIGPFEPGSELFARIGEVRTHEGLLAFEEHFRGDSTPEEADADILNITANARFIDGTPRLTAPEAMLDDTTSFAVLHPSKRDVEVLLDFGREIVGYCDIALRAPEGVVVDAHCFEAVWNGRRQWTHGNRSTFRYITREGLQTWTSAWRRGFRYMSLTFRNVTAPVHIHGVRALSATYPVVERGAFHSSDPLLNEIWRMGRHTLRCCMEDTFTDCPTYEQTYWVGDARNEALICHAAYGAYDIVRRCVKLAALSMERSPLVESQVPSGWQNVLTAWSLLWVLMADEYYEHTGDVAYLKEVYPTVAQMLRTCRTYRKNRWDLFEIDAWNLFDWAPIDQHHPIAAHNNFLLMGALARAARMAAALGKPEDETDWLAFRDEIRTAANQHLWSHKHGAYIDSIHEDGTPSHVLSHSTNTLALLYDAVPPERMAEVKAVVLDPPEGFVRFGSPFAMFYLLECLAAQGMFQSMYDTIRKRWGEMVDAGATTCWETFPGWEAVFPTRSHCHAWSAGPTWFLSRYMLGVSPGTPGFGAVRIAPEPCGVRFCRGRFPSPHGEIGIDWSSDEKGFTLTAALPMEMAATVILPVDASVMKVLSWDGRHMHKLELPHQVRDMTVENGRWRIETAPTTGFTLRATSH